MLNITIVGRLGSDPEVRETTGGHSVCNVNIAVTSQHGAEKRTTWLRLAIWGKRGVAFAQYHSKGGMAAVCGQLSCRKWQGDTGERESWEVDVQSWSFCGSASEQGAEKRAEADEPIPF